MADKKRPTLKSLGQQLDTAHRFYAAGELDRAGQTLNLFKTNAERVLVDQEKAMTTEMNYHLRLRNELHELTEAAVKLSRAVKGVDNE